MRFLKQQALFSSKEKSLKKIEKSLSCLLQFSFGALRVKGNNSQHAPFGTKPVCVLSNSNLFFMHSLIYK